MQEARLHHAKMLTHRVMLIVHGQWCECMIARVSPAQLLVMHAMGRKRADKVVGADVCSVDKSLVEVLL